MKPPQIRKTTRRSLWYKGSAARLHPSRWLLHLFLPLCELSRITYRPATYLGWLALPLPPPTRGGETIPVSRRCKCIPPPRPVCTFSHQWRFYFFHPPLCVSFPCLLRLHPFCFRPCDRFHIKVPPLTQWLWQPTAGAPRLPLLCS